MTIHELAEMKPRDARNWVRNAARNDLNECIEERMAFDIDDYSSTELRQALFEAWVDGDLGTRVWGRKKLMKEILDQVREEREDVEADIEEQDRLRKRREEKGDVE